MTTLAILQPYVPSYRVAFFDGLVQALAGAGITCRIVAGYPKGAQAARGDSRDAEWLIRVPTRAIRFAGHSLTFTGGRSRWRSPDGVIVGLAGTNLDAYRMMFSRARLGVWGHIDSYVNPANGLDTQLEKGLLRGADHVFAYTPGGAAYARSCGVAEPKITTVMNTIPTGDLERALADTSARQVERFRADHGISHSPVFSYVGGLDGSKRVDFMADYLDELWRLEPAIKFLVAGSGEASESLAPAVARGQVVRFPYADERLKALIFRSSRALVVPGRIGLVAVDALVARLPVLTTDWPFHAPEAEYLTEGISRFTSEDDPVAYARMITHFAHGGIAGTVRDAAFPTMASMVERFSHGVRVMMS